MGNTELLKAFLSKRRLAETTMENYGTALKTFDNVTDKPIGEIEKADLEAWYDSINGTHKAGTIFTYASRLRQIHIYALTEKGLKKRDAKTTSDELFEALPLKDLNRASKKENKLKDQLIHPDEFKALMRGAKHPKTQAIIAMLYDSAARKSELLSLRIRDVEFRNEEGYVLIRVHGKTGERAIPLVDSIPYLKQWLQVHPLREDLDAPLFTVTVKGRIKQMDSRTINHAMRRICKKMGLRLISPHQLRHSKLTDLAKAGAGEFNMKSFAGWTPNSNMASRYIHMSGESHVDSILGLQGFDVENGRNGIPQVFTKVKCPNCDNEAPGDSQFCPYCGYVLDEKLRMERVDREGEIDVLRSEVSELKNMLFQILNDPDLVDEVKKRLEINN